MKTHGLFKLQRDIYHLMQEYGLTLSDIKYEHVSTEQKERIFQAVLVLLDDQVDKSTQKSG